MIEVVPLAAAIGARVDGVDLRTLDEAQFADIHDALMAHAVLFFRDQDLDDDEHLEFAARFGEVAVYPVTKLLGGDTRLSYIEDTADSPPDADGWHTDITWIAQPPKVAVLSARLIPDVGGDTLWASLYAAYDALSPVMQHVVEQLEVYHHPGPEFAAAIERQLGKEIADRVRTEFPGATHPLVRTHPVTGRKALFVSGLFMQHVVGMHPDESDMLLRYLRAQVDNPNIQVRWHWRADDVAVWDERCTNHRALSDHFPRHRRMRRCTVEG